MCRLVGKGVDKGKGKGKGVGARPETPKAGDHDASDTVLLARPCRHPLPPARTEPTLPSAMWHEHRGDAATAFRVPRVQEQAGSQREQAVSQTISQLDQMSELVGGVLDVSGKSLNLFSPTNPLRKACTAIVNNRSDERRPRALPRPRRWSRPPGKLYHASWGHAGL